MHVSLVLFTQFHITEMETRAEQFLQMVLTKLDLLSDITTHKVMTTRAQIKHLLFRMT